LREQAPETIHPLTSYFAGNLLSSLLILPAQEPLDCRLDGHLKEGGEIKDKERGEGEKKGKENKSFLLLFRGLSFSIINSLVFLFFLFFFALFSRLNKKYINPSHVCASATAAMLIDGEKWACEACVRGHRVSSCHHSDRPLTHINKKGRPVSQCAHCRGLRKSRTTHVKCECGDKKNSSCHADPNAVDKVDGRPRCACAHGQRCICALKKEHHLDPVPETGLPPTQPLAVEVKKPRLTSTKSESTLTIFRDGYHKPVHKHNDMAHKCGLPYTIPRSHSIHSMSEIAQRSADHLPLPSNTVELPLSFEALPGAPTRLVKSEHGSPERAPLPILEQINTQIPPLDISSFSPFGTANDSPLNSIFPDQYQDPWFASPDTDVSLNSAGLSAPPVDWSSLPLCSSGAPTSASSQPPSYTSLDYGSSNLNYSGLAASSSGEISEVDEFGPLPGLGASSSNDLHDFHSSANDSSIALEQHLHATIGMESKTIPASHGYNVRSAQTYGASEPVSAPMTSASHNDMMWPSSLFDSALPTSAAEEPFPQQQWIS